LVNCRRAEIGTAQIDADCVWKHMNRHNTTAV
jgi:hypothetical protein